MYMYKLLLCIQDMNCTIGYDLNSYDLDMSIAVLTMQIQQDKDIYKPGAYTEHI